MAFLIAQANVPNAHPANVWDWFTSMDADNLAGIAFLVFGSIFAIVLTVSLIVYYMHKNRLLDGLKRELLDRGFSAEEIVMIVQAKPRPRAIEAAELQAMSKLS